jgi:nucleoid-associated protein YgaU
MPKDANWGLVIGAAAVIIIAVLFFRNDGAVGGSANVPGLGSTTTPVPGVPNAPSGRTHRVEDGDTLTSIAVKYYGDARHTLFLYRVNKDQLLAPDKLPTGALLVVPEAPPALAHRAE